MAKPSLSDDTGVHAHGVVEKRLNALDLEVKDVCAAPRRRARRHVLACR